MTKETFCPICAEHGHTSGECPYYNKSTSPNATESRPPSLDALKPKTIPCCPECGWTAGMHQISCCVPREAELQGQVDQLQEKLHLKEELKPCPFCGGEAEFECSPACEEGGDQIWCKTCHCRSPWIDPYYESAESGKLKALKAWNTRPIQATNSVIYENDSLKSKNLSLSRQLEEAKKEIEELKTSGLAGSLAAEVVILKTAMLDLANECNCRREHGAEGGEHLRYIEKRLRWHL